MTSVADFIKLPKTDFHSTLNFGMRYSSYVTWAGFYIPDFPVNNTDINKELKKEIEEYTFLRLGCQSDVQKLLLLSIAESLGDNIRQLEGAINIELLSRYGSVSSIAELLQTTRQKYKGQLELNPFLSINSDTADKKNLTLAQDFLKSGCFSGLYIYGKTLFEQPQNFKQIADSACLQNLNLKINAGESSLQELSALFKIFTPQTIVQADSFAGSKEILSVLKNEKIKVIFTPGMSAEQKAQSLRAFLDSGISCALGTKSILLFNKSISQFARELCNTKVFTKEEMTKLVSC